ncbi:hypothetical protein [Treponema sp. C6A8]|uniref:hypothetical protein n=1 Tax=Treponema sp. C6A8 TaxID=1410609 RepID=UPI0004843380|nr:hypothetical protein [Treponema sp. C6A8]
MDDKEYYSIMNRTSSFVIKQVLEKNKKKVGKALQKSFTKLEQYQGRDDAEMLLEKQNNFDN